MRAPVAELALDEVHDNPHQPRFEMDDEVIAGARAMIARTGGFPVSMAIVVRPRPQGGFEIIAGHHRVRAAREEGLETVSAHVEDLDDREAALALAATNNQRGMSPLEHAKHALWLEDAHGVTIEEYATACGKSKLSMNLAIAAFRVLADHGGPSGPNAGVPIVAIAGLVNVLDDAKRAALLYQFKKRQTTGAQAAEVIARVRAGVATHEAFRLAEGGIEREAAPSGSPTWSKAGDATAVAAVHRSNEVITAMEWTLALYQARAEELEALLSSPLAEQEPHFSNRVATRMQRILRELRADPARHLVKPPLDVACASCAHGRPSALSDVGFICEAQRARECMPLTQRKFWVSKEDEA